MVKVYYLAPDKIRLYEPDESFRESVALMWRQSGGRSGQVREGSIDLIEGSPVRFRGLVKHMSETRTARRAALAVERCLEGAARAEWELPLAGGGTLEVGQKPLIMGVVNVTPDSFSDGGRFLETDKAISHGMMLAEEGADILDIGGESTRPGAEPVPLDEECKRVLPVVEGLAQKVGIPVSIDTRKPEVARKAIMAGARIINDATMLTYDPSLAAVAAESGASLVINHIRGTPGDMQEDPRYDDLWPEISDDLENAVEKARSHGLAREAIVLDPGIGFGKTLDHNLEILKGLHALTASGRPVMVGPSRKRFIGAVLGLEPDERLEGTMAACVMALAEGAVMFRVHDVKPHRRALDLAWAIHKSRPFE